jgi:hypothetical protein
MKQNRCLHYIAITVVPTTSVGMQQVLRSSWRPAQQCRPHRFEKLCACERHYAFGRRVVRSIYNANRGESTSRI